MFLLLNQEYQQIEKILSDLMAKMKKSKCVARLYPSGYELYELDTVCIYFSPVSYRMIVTDKNRKEIVSLDCQYDVDNELQCGKNDLFVGFLRAIRDEYKKRIGKKTELADDVANAQQAAQARRLKILSDALDKLRGL